MSDDHETANTSQYGVRTRYRSENGMQASQSTSILCTVKTRRRTLLTIIITAINVDSDEYQPGGPAACKVGLKQTVKTLPSWKKNSE